MRSVSYRRLSRRERFVLLGGVAAVAATLLSVFAIAPTIRRWNERESVIAVKAAQRARLLSLAEQEKVIRAAAEERRRARGSSSKRLLSGDTRAVAASDLQSLVRRYAEQSRVVLERIEVADDGSAAADGLGPIPVTLSARGDLSGLTDLLFYLQNGEKLLVIDEVNVNVGPPQRDGVQLLRWSVRLHGYFAADDVS